MERTRQQQIETARVHLAVAKLHGDEDRVQQFTWELEALTNDAIVTEIDNIWSK